MSATVTHRVLDYFDLRSSMRGPRGEQAAPGLNTVWASWQRNLWPLCMYAAGVVGVVARQWYDSHQRGDVFDLRPSTFILAVAVSAVTYPVLYHSLQAESKPLVQLFLAIQNGFFWPTVLNQVMH